MSKKRILNVTSRKKQDTMLSFSNTGGTGNSVTVGQGSLYVNGSTGFAMSVFCPTARSLATAGATNQVTDTNDRTSVTCYMRGYKEDVRVQTNSPAPWLWRRVCFTYKGDDFLEGVPNNNATAFVQNYLPYSDTSIGMARKWFNLQVNNMPETVTAFNAIIFKGRQGFDWNDIITAKVDNTRITVKSDHVRRITTGNNAGHFSERKLWYPMNSNLVYDDDEVGGQMETSYTSVDAKAGMGDYYIVDYIVPGVAATSSDLININCTASLYWHEK